MPQIAVERARAMLGVRFRPQGRSEETGLDCVGLVLQAHDLPSGMVRADYRLSGDHLAELDDVAGRFFRPVAAGVQKSGDVLVLRTGPSQLHLAIHCGGSFVHADAAIGRVVETPYPATWPLLRVFRRRAQKEF